MSIEGLTNVNLYEEIFSFFDSEEHKNIIRAAKKNLGCKPNPELISVDTLKQVADKFKIGRTTVYYIRRIKDEADEELLSDFLNGKISITKAIRILNNNGLTPKKCIYFMQHSYSKKIKIGKTEYIASRYDTINRHNAGDIELLLTVDGYTKEETALHRKFAEYRITGEWFEPTQKILDYIEELKQDNFSLPLIKKESKPQKRRKKREEFVDIFAD